MIHHTKARGLCSREPILLICVMAEATAELMRRHDKGIIDNVMRDVVQQDLEFNSRTSLLLVKQKGYCQRQSYCPWLCPSSLRVLGTLGGVLYLVLQESKDSACKSGVYIEPVSLLFLSFIFFGQ